MKISIYNQPSVGGINGVESSVVTLARALSEEHEVEIVHDAPNRTKERLERFYGVPLDNVDLRNLPRQRRRRPQNPFRRYRDMRSWLRDASSGCDLFITFSASMPPYCHAPQGLLMIVFPLDKRPTRNGGRNPWRRLHGYLEKTEWDVRLGSYQLATANSHFSRQWIQERWGLESQVVYAPAEAEFPSLPKENLILSVGRFATGGTRKNQLELMRLYSNMKPELPPSWTYQTVGPLGKSAEDRSYFAAVRELSAQCNGKARNNLQFEQLKELYASAKLFWHAAGYGVDPDEHPDLMEHFGIVTVEAMAAGCVPLVIDKGGQPEIVEHGVSGFVWRTLTELRDYTRLLAADEVRRERMSEAARTRARSFGRQAYVDRVIDACQSAGLL